MNEHDREDMVAARQDGRVYPVGRALRTTFHADNHDTLGQDLTGLMIDLSKVPFGPDEAIAPAAAARRPVAAHPVAAAAPPPTLLSRIAGLFGRRH